MRPHPPGRVPSALVLRALGLGDFLTAVPALRALRRALADHRLVLVAPEALRGLVQLCDAVDDLLPAGELEPVPWPGATPPDVAVNLHGRGPQSHRLLRRLNPGRLIGFGNEAAGEPGPPWRPDEHERARWSRLVASGFGVRADPDDVRISVPRVRPAVRGAFVVHPGAAYASRRWPPDRFAAVVRRAAGDRPVVVTGGPQEVPLAREVADAAGLPRDAVLAGRTDLVGLAALVAAADVLVCGDTGVAHLASAYRTPSVLLFGPTPPSAWGPPPGPHRVLWRGTSAGDPFGAVPDPALLDITVADVVAELSALDCARRPVGPTGAGA